MKIVKRIVSVLVLGASLAVCGCSDDPTDPVPPREPGVLVVTADGSGDFPTIQDAIDYSVDGDTIELGNGTYRGDGNRDIDFLGKSIMVRSASGDPDSCVLNVEGAPDDRHRGFYFHSGEGIESTLEGVTISNGNAPGGGGGVLCELASPRLENLVIRNHQLSGIHVSRASPVIESCRLEANDGDALAVWGSNPTVRDCEFIGNIGNAVGLFGSSAIVEHCMFVENQGDYSGAVHVGAEADSGGFVSFRDCVFVGNRANRFGGAVLFASPGELVNCLIVDNIAGEAGGGAKVALPSAKVMVIGTTIVGNKAPIASGVYVTSGADIEVDNSIIAFGEGGTSVECDTSQSVVYGPIEIAVACSDVFGNEGGDWVECIEDMKDVNGNIYSDPLFCSLMNRDLSLRQGSPCWQPACGLMGALGVGCSEVSVDAR